jgi:hypothetical protein
LATVSQDYRQLADMPIARERLSEAEQAPSVSDLSILDQRRGSLALWSGLVPGRLPLVIRPD